MLRSALTLPAFLLSCSLVATAWAEETLPGADAPDTDAAASEAAPQTSERAPLAERTEIDALALQRQLDLREQQQLQAGDEKFLALWLPANAGKPNGVVIIVPGDDESADWPQGVGPLRRKLPDAGWHSLSLTLPAPSSDAPPLRSPEAEPGTAAAEESGDAGQEATEPDEQAPEDASEQEQQIANTAPAGANDAEAARLSHADRVMARIDAAIALAEQQQAERITLLGHGSGAYWAARYLSERQPDNIRHLLLVSATLPAGYSPPLDELIPALKLATVDFFYKDQLTDRQAASRRMQASKRQQHPGYAQVALKALPGNREAEQEQLYRRVRGWLDSQAKGK
jgi:hypothetical protein